MAKFNPSTHRFTKQAKIKTQAEKKAAERQRRIWNRAMKKATTELQRARAYVNRADAILLKAVEKAVELGKQRKKGPKAVEKAVEMGPESCGEASGSGGRRPAAAESCGCCG